MGPDPGHGRRHVVADTVINAQGCWQLTTFRRVVGRAHQLLLEVADAVEETQSSQPLRPPVTAKSGCRLVIAEDLFDAAQQVSYDNTQFSPRNTEPGEWLLRGLVVCGRCKVGTNCHMMRGRNGTWHRYCYCRNYDVFVPVGRPALHRAQHPRQ